MFGAYTVDRIRAAEAAAMTGPDDLTLMMRAATGLAVHTAAQLRHHTGGVSGRRLLVLVGPGNNGGDALFAGAWLARRGVAVGWCPVLGSHHRAGAAALDRAGGRRVALDDLAGEVRRASVVMDGVLGIGGRAGLPGHLVSLASAIVQAGVPVLAVDLPSGLDADSGAAGLCVPATTTVTFGARKLCQVIAPAVELCGCVELVDIGLALPEPAIRCWEPSDVADVWPVPGAASHKYTRGVVAVDAGSDAYPGAGLLAVAGAVGAGAGMVRFVGGGAAPEALAERIVSLFPNVVHGDGRVQAAVLGPGWGDRPDGAATLAAWLERDIPLVVDADALRPGVLDAVAGSVPSRVVLTPHAGELSRLLDVDRAEIEADPAAAVTEAAGRTGATVLLKGATQLVARPGAAPLDRAVPGPAWTGQAGSGDVLAGLIGTLAAAGLDPHVAAIAGASIQAIAAARHPGPIPPQRLAALVPGTIGGLTSAAPNP